MKGRLDTVRFLLSRDASDIFYAGAPCSLGNCPLRAKPRSQRLSIVPEEALGIGDGHICNAVKIPDAVGLAAIANQAAVIEVLHEVVYTDAAWVRSVRYRRRKNRTKAWRKSIQKVSLSQSEERRANGVEG